MTALFAMWRPFAGFTGLTVGVLTFAIAGARAYFTKSSESYNMDPHGAPGTFEPFLARYLRGAEFMIGLATGSIVLLVGSSALHGQTGHLPWFYASPLLLLCLCVLYGVGFMVWLIFNYENYAHGNQYTARRYALTEALGFSSFLCFFFGYVALVFAVTR